MASIAISYDFYAFFSENYLRKLYLNTKLENFFFLHFLDSSLETKQSEETFIDAKHVGDHNPSKEPCTNSKLMSNNSASTSPVRQSGNKRRLDSPDIVNVECTESESAKKTKADEDNRKKQLDRIDSKEVFNKSISEKSRYYKKSEDRLTRDQSTVPNDKHSKDSLFDSLRTEHTKNEQHKDNGKKPIVSVVSMPSRGDNSYPRERHLLDKENYQVDNKTDNKTFFDAIELRSSEEEKRLRQERRETKMRKEVNKIVNNSDDETENSSFRDSRDKHQDYKNSRSDNPSSDDHGTTTLKKQRGKSSRLPQSNNTSDETDSDGRKKHSIFDIPDEGPYVSMYDKVKARSCKNMQKQEEEKKIKAKFGKLKRSRAKREGKKRSTSWEEDSDTDDEEPRYTRVNHKGLMSSSDDESMINVRRKDSLGSDSDQEKSQYMRSRCNDMCDGESSEPGNEFHQKPRRKICSRTNSRTTRRTIDSSDEDVKSFKSTIKLEQISEDEIKLEKSEVDLRSLKLKTEVVPELNQEVEILKFSSQIPDTDVSKTPISTPATLERKSSFENIFGYESKKKHKKNKKRQKSFPMDSTDEDVIPLSERRDSFGSSEHSKSTTHEPMEGYVRTKHGSKKDKRREKNREEHERKKAKKANKLLSKQQSDAKHEEKMEDIFGPISDDESHTTKAPHSSPSSSKTSLNAFDPLRQQKPLNPKVIKNSDEHQHTREEGRRKRDKKRRDKHKNQIREDENSVDLDEAGRALEAQLMSDSDIKPEDQQINDEPGDVFHFSEDEDSLDASFDTTKKEENDQIHRKEKKKKKKRSKEEKHKHHHHSKNHETFEKFTSPEPSLPCLMDDSPKILTAPPRGNGMTSPLLSIEPKNIAENPLKKGEEIAIKRKQPEIFIPGFGGELDEKIHEKAVLSIAEEMKCHKLDSSVVGLEVKESSIDRADSPRSLDGKTEEKSRVVISQEETEDAVAALLGESFGTTNAPDYNEIFDEPVEEPPSLSIEPVIPEQDDEEMKKAIQSLNTDELNVKPDTPQSEQDLQIDTDTEEQDGRSQFDIPPKTPDIDFAQLKKNAEQKQHHSPNNISQKLISSLTVTEEKSQNTETTKTQKGVLKQNTQTEASAKLQDEQYTVSQPSPVKVSTILKDKSPSSNTEQLRINFSCEITDASPHQLSKPGIVSPTTAVIPSIEIGPTESSVLQQGLVQGKQRPTISPTPSADQIIFNPKNSITNTSSEANIVISRFPIAQIPVQQPLHAANVNLSQPTQAVITTSQKPGKFNVL